MKKKVLGSVSLGLSVVASPWCLALLSFATLACLACSSSSTSNGQGDDDAAAGMTNTADSAGAGATTSDSSTPSAQMGNPAECAGSNPFCSSCCAKTFPGGGQPFALAEQDCLCSGAGACADVCSAQECQDETSNIPACEACIQQRTPMCQQMGQTACQADPFCKAYAACETLCN